MRKTIYRGQRQLSRDINTPSARLYGAQRRNLNIGLTMLKPLTVEQYEPAACWFTIALKHDPFLLPETLPRNLFVKKREKGINWNSMGR